MHTIVLIGVVSLALIGLALAAEGPTTRPASVLDNVVKDIHGKDHDLSQYRGRVVMIVNVASMCGLTGQYKALEELYRQHKDVGLVVIGFPANDFGNQEPGTDEQILAFCTGRYDVTFPMMSKISVKGADKHAVYRFLTEPQTAGHFSGEIGWNFTKFLISRDGTLAARFDSRTKPDAPEVITTIEDLLRRE
jgi:glutathione peroxidase